MKICVISTPVFVHPPAGYSGLEMLAWQQAKGLAAKGHNVWLVAPDGSTCPGVNIISVGPAGQTDEHAAYNKYWQILPQMNCIIDNSWQKFSYLLKQEGNLKAPILGVCHAPVNTMFNSLPAIEKPCFVCISQNQATIFQGLFNTPARVAYNGCFDGATLIDLENGLRERLDDFVRRKGTERILAWDREGGRLTYAQVEDWMELEPVNNFAIEICVEGLNSSLISTPDNLIMTKEGWKEAHLLTADDEVMYGIMDEMDGTRNRVCHDLVWEKETERNGQPIESGTVINLQHCSANQGTAIKPNSKGLLDRRRNQNNQRKLFLQIIRRPSLIDSQTFKISNKGNGNQIESGKVEESLLPKTNFGRTPEHSANRCCLSSGFNRWRRLCDYSPRQEKIYIQSVLRNCQHRSSDYRACQEMVANFSMARGSQNQHIVSQTGLARGGDRNNCGTSSKTDYPIYDCEKSQGFSDCRILRNCLGAKMESETNSETNRDISVCSPGKFPTWRHVVSVRRISTPARVFDLKTNTSTFVANGIVVHNCNLGMYQPIPGIQRTNRYLFLARFSSIKGPHLAIEACQKANAELDLIGDTSITNEPELLEHCKQMADGEKIKLIGPATRGECVWWFSKGYCLLHPNKSFPEPFGLSPVESQACECPVIAWHHGAMPETVKHGETGFLVHNLEEMIELIKTDAIRTINRKRCREWTSQFSEERMIDRYEELCVEAIETGGW